jgi:ribonucleoside-triphosphate reductase
LTVKKRDGRKVKFDKEKIKIAVLKAFIDVDGEETAYAKEKARDIANYIESLNKSMTVEEIQDQVVNKLMASIRKDVATKYVEYRYKRKLVRESNTTDKSILELIDGVNDYWNSENSNKSASVVTTQRDYLAGITSTDITRRFLLPKDVVQAHDEGIIHFHDADYFAQHMHNCCLINLEDMLQNGTVINGTLIEKPHRFLTAMTIATQIITAVTSSQYGGATITLTHLAPFVRDSYNRYLKKYLSWGFAGKESIEWAKKDLQKEIQDGVQTFQYQLNSMTNTNGQSPFLSVFMYLGETEEYKEELSMIIQEMLLQRIEGLKNEVGVYITPAFPKLLYVLEEDNIHEDSKYWYLTELAARCTAKRLVPDFMSEKVMKRLKDGNMYPVMGCRSALTVWHNKNNIPKFYGRFNQGVVTINLVDLALSSECNVDRFWELFEERTELCHKALKCRHERLEGTLSDAAPIMWQYGALARLDKHKPIDDLLHNGYSTLSLGYAGLYECVKYMTGKSHTDNAVGTEFGLKVMRALNDKCNQWKKEEHIDYSLYGTPIESTTYKFAKCLQKRFGVIEGITDKNYITNSYHVNVREEIDPFTKLEIESKFQELSPGGAISYIESSNMNDNIPALLEVMKFIYENIMYAEVNTKSDYCQLCGYSGEIQIVKENNELVWECPNCKNRDQDKMNIARRTCGYIGSHYWNQGRTQEIMDRWVHLDDHEYKEGD